MLVSQMVDAFWELEQGAALQKRLQSEPERSEEGELTGLPTLKYTCAFYTLCCMCQGLLVPAAVW